MIFLTFLLTISPIRTASSLDPNSPRQQLLYAAAHDPSAASAKITASALALIFNKSDTSFSPQEFIAPYLHEPIPTLSLSENALVALKNQATLKNRTLLGSRIITTDEIENVQPDQIDLARSLFLIQYNNDLQKVEAEEAALDLFA